MIRNLARFARLVVLVLSTLAAGRANAVQVILYEEHFDTDTGSTGTTLSTYPGWSLSGSGPVTVSGGILNLGNSTSNNFTRAGYSGDIVIEGKLGGTGAITAGSSRAEWVIGGVNALFHVNYGTGAFRLEGAVSQSNTDIGFTPATGVLHGVKVRQRPSGLFDVTITNGSNPLQSYTTTFTHLGSVGGAFGPRYGAPGIGIFDDIVVRYAAEFDSPDLDVQFFPGPAGPVTLTDAIIITNPGELGSDLQITGISITGADAAAFSVPDFVATTLTVGGIDTVLFDVTAIRSGGDAPLNATLTFFTNIGNFDFDLSVAGVPEPSSYALLGLGAVGLAWGARRKRLQK